MNIEFFSATYPGEEDEHGVFFVIFDEETEDQGSYEGASEEVVRPFLDDRWKVVAENSWEFNGSFEEGKKTLIDLGFQYGGPVDEDARS